ncbi:hypothetical protein NP493_86g05020 [Ridgeia piscesae]|uniref:Receptor ligand binding region domain-containing protein n=1 Tax=Ridgeia piscesae TaxID=27915 RepID=A0AAD9UI77_RIDPI|nr:hypothetical protein NP493_86g05020 [Ridgeia piscesae]
MPAASAAVLWGAALALALSCFLVLVSPSAAAAEKTDITILAVVKHMVLLNRRTRGSVNRFVHTLNDPRRTTLDSGFLEKYHLRATIAFSINLSPPEILDIVCREVREKRINAIFYMSDLLYEDESSGSTLYLMQIAKFLGLPIVAWFPESSGVIQPTDGSLLLQMSPTIRHQVRAMFSILRRYNWKHFCVVTGETLGRNYFINVLRSLVDRSDGWFNLLSTIQVTTRDTSHLRTQLQEIVSVESRVVLIYASE